MAEEKKESKPESTSLIVYVPIIFIILILVVGSATEKKTIFELSETTDEETIQNSEQVIKDFFDLYRMIGNGEQKLGATIINTKDVTVRTGPAGSILGIQKKLKTGRLLEGPIEEFGTNWWRVDYEMAPDGWVEFHDLTTRIAIVRTINIGPLAYDFYKPIGYSFLFILVLFLIFFRLKLSKEERIYEKQKELRRQQYQPHESTPQEIKARMEEKPVVEQLPGFQTEEIVPSKIEQKNNRWKHIQELIGSYNASDWRQAIIEADIMLEEMIDKMGYQGTSIGEKLKTIEKSDFVTLDKAWSAHRIRNQIAHDGSAFKLTREVAERTIKEYEMVFKEFYYI